MRSNLVATAVFVLAASCNGSGLFGGSGGRGGANAPAIADTIYSGHWTSDQGPSGSIEVHWAADGTVTAALSGSSCGDSVSGTYTYSGGQVQAQVDSGTDTWEVVGFAVDDHGTGVIRLEYEVVSGPCVGDTGVVGLEYVADAAPAEAVEEPLARRRIFVLGEEGDLLASITEEVLKVEAAAAR